MTAPLCSTPRCTRKAHANSMCKGHYDRFRRHGSAFPEIPLGTPVNSKVSPGFGEECLICVDVDWLLKFGTDPRQVMVRLGYNNLRPLRNHLIKHNRPDLAKRFDLRSIDGNESSLEISA